jgi:hypothetical protein
MEIKRTIAESYFKLAHACEGDTLFREYFAEFLDYGWGWVVWSEQYLIMARENNKNSGRAIHILKQALEEEDLKDRYEVLDRLVDIYDETEMFEELNVREQIVDILKKRDVQWRVASLLSIPKDVPVTARSLGGISLPLWQRVEIKKCCG